jgi:GT2 family glycosyltransferase
MKLVTFAVVVYNNYEETLYCVESISNMNGESVEVKCCIIDNSDKRETQNKIDSLASQYCFVKILRPTSNLGYFGAFNFLFEKINFDKREIVVLCNNDLAFFKNFATVLCSERYPKDVYVVCPDVMTLDGVHQNPHVLKPRNFVKRFKLDAYYSHYYIACFLLVLQRILSKILKPRKRIFPAEAGYLHMGIGACYVLLPAFLLRFKKLDFPHFLYGEEAYLTRQVHSAGGKLFYDPNLKVEHKESATLSKLPKRITYEFGRAGYFSYRKFY